MPDQRIAQRILADPVLFSQVIIRRPLRRYQAEILRTIARSVLAHDGQEYVVTMSRQAGKNELSAHLETYLLNRYRTRGGQIVKCAPTFAPQCVNSIVRLVKCLSNDWNRATWSSQLGYIIKLGLASVQFLSAHPSAAVLGATADIMLECDEAQDVDIARFQKDFLPMAASTNAVRVYYGTAWTSATLLAQAAATLPPQNVFRVDCWRIAEEVPAYGEFVKRQMARLGIDHPIVRTQYLLQEIDEQAGMFSGLIVQMHGDHPPGERAISGHDYALLLDVAGEAESPSPPAPLPEGEGSWGEGDSTALTIVELDYSTLATLGLPTYRVVHRRRWLGTKHPVLYAQLLDLARIWSARYIVVDATGVGAGLASFLSRALGPRVIPFHFSTKTKSELGWNFIATIQTGRFKDYATDAGDAEQVEFWRQVSGTRYTIHPGPGHTMSWGAEPHDDLVISAALCAHLDQLEWRADTMSQIIHAPDPLGS